MCSSGRRARRLGEASPGTLEPSNPGTLEPSNPDRLTIVLIRPSRYDEEGYVVRHWRGTLPSNTLSCLNGLTEDAVAAGEDRSDRRLRQRRES